MSKIRLIVRTDDAASCSEASRAIAACVNVGIVRGVSVMAVGPELEEAARLLAGREAIEIGFHFALNSEWERIKWGPVAPPELVPSLINEQGHFLPFPHDLKRKGFVVAEAMIEAKAQLDRLRAVGFRPAYLDEHCGCSAISLELFAALEQFAVQEGLVHADPIYSLPGQGNDFAARVAAAPPGDYVLVTHPGIDEVEGQMRQFYLAGQPNDGSVARERDAERQALCATGLQEALELAGAKLATYTEVLAQ